MHELTNSVRLKVDTFVCVVGIPLKLAIILPACTFYGIYVYQRDRSLRLTFLERLTTQSLLAHLSSTTTTSGSDSLILVNVASSQVEYLNSQARDLFLASDEAQASIVRAETGTVRGEYSRKIVERLASAFFEVGKVSEREAEAQPPVLMGLYERMKDSGLETMSAKVRVVDEDASKKRLTGSPKPS
jgi:hypothetical protein